MQAIPPWVAGRLGIKVGDVDPQAEQRRRAGVEAARHTLTGH